MEKLKPIDIEHKFIRSLRRENTGNRKEFAKHLGISPTRVTVYKNKIEMIYKVTILYNRKSETYFVSENDLGKLPPPI
ncbi:MAG: hypothetical protein WCX31_13930 [Salinivirgaceae bacterium]